MTGGSKPPAASPGCPLLPRLYRAGWRWATCTWLLATCELSFPPRGGGTLGLASPGSLLLRATQKALGNKGSGGEGIQGQACRAVITVPAAGPHHTHTGPIVGHGDALALG